MSSYLKYTAVGIVAFLVGGAAIVSANALGHFVISNEAGTNTARVGPAGRLHVNARVNNFPEVQTVQGSVTVDNLPGAVPVYSPLPPSVDPSSIVNIPAFMLDIPSELPFGVAPPCLPESSYTVPDGKTLFITDVVAQGGDLTALGTVQRGTIFRIFPALGGDTLTHMQLDTPLTVDGGETVCPFRTAGQMEVVSHYFFFSGHLVEPTPVVLTLTGSVIGRTSPTTTPSFALDRDALNQVSNLGLGTIHSAFIATVEFQVTNGGAVGSLDLSSDAVVITYIDKDQARNLPPSHWSATWLVGDSTQLDLGEIVEFSLQLNGALTPTLGASTQFSIEVKPTFGQPALMFTRTTPDELTPVVIMD